MARFFRRRIVASGEVEIYLSRFIRLKAYITVQVCIKSQMGTKQLTTTLLNSVITLKLIIWVRKKKNVR